MREQAHRLECPAKPLSRVKMGRRAAGSPAVDDNVTATGTLEAGEHVDERRLAGAIRADEAEDLTGPNGQFDLVKRNEAVKPYPHAVG